MVLLPFNVGDDKNSHCEASSDKEYNKAASFRKILQATLQDPRVIIIKLADRYHNMTTLDALRPDKRARIAQETFDIFVPIEFYIQPKVRFI